MVNWCRVHEPKIMDIGSAILNLKIFQKMFEKIPSDLKISKNCNDVKDVKNLGRKFSLKPKITLNKNWVEHSTKHGCHGNVKSLGQTIDTKMLLDNF